MFILSNMRFKIVVVCIILLAFVGFASAETFTPTNGTFAYREVEIFVINGINFTVPTDYDVTFENATEMDFMHGNDKLNISVTENGTVKKVAGNKTGNVTSARTMFGSVEGYFVDENGTYTFSYRQDGKLVVINSKNMPLMIGAMEMY